MPTVDWTTLFNWNSNGKLFMKPSKVIHERVVGKLKLPAVSAVGSAVPSDQPIAQLSVVPAILSWCRRTCAASLVSVLMPNVAVPGVARPAMYERAESCKQVVST